MYYRKEVIFQMKKQRKVTSQSAMLQQNTRSTYQILIISIVMLILFIGSNMYPVSYTHLDVYKRQE